LEINCYLKKDYIEALALQLIVGSPLLQPLALGRRKRVYCESKCMLRPTWWPRGPTVGPSRMDWRDRNSVQVAPVMDRKELGSVRCPHASI